MHFLPIFSRLIYFAYFPKITKWRVMKVICPVTGHIIYSTSHLKTLRFQAVCKCVFLGKKIKEKLRELRIGPEIQGWTKHQPLFLSQTWIMIKSHWKLCLSRSFSFPSIGFLSQVSCLGQRNLQSSAFTHYRPWSLPWNSPLLCTLICLQVLFITYSSYSSGLILSYHFYGHLLSHT